MAIIAGAASGIGAATAMLFAQEKARGFIADIDAQQGEQTAQEIFAAGGEAWFVPTAVGHRLQSQRLLDMMVREFKRVDILHNNAFWSVSKLVVELEEPDWD